MGKRTETTIQSKSRARELADLSWGNTRGYVQRRSGKSYVNKDGSLQKRNDPRLSKRIETGEAVEARTYRTQKAREAKAAKLLKEAGGDRKAAEKLRIARARAAGRKGAERRWAKRKGAA